MNTHKYYNSSKSLLDYQYKFLEQKEICSRMTREEIIGLIKEDGSNIKYIDNPDEELQLLAIRTPRSIYLAKHKSGFNISYIKNPTYKVCQEFLFNTINSFSNKEDYHAFYLVHDNKKLKDLMSFINPECDCFEDVKQLYEFLKK
jgi:predicted AlkP superfamily phosphohydrolase/phosphomutase